MPWGGCCCPGGGGTGTGGIGSLPLCVCTTIPSPLTLTNLTPACSFGELADATIEYGPIPGPLVAVGVTNPSPGFYSTASFSDRVFPGYLFYYVLNCQDNIFQINLYFYNPTTGDFFENDAAFVWQVGDVNTCSSTNLSLLSGTAVTVDGTCEITITS